MRPKFINGPNHIEKLVTQLSKSCGMLFKLINYTRVSQPEPSPPLGGHEQRPFTI